MKSSVHLKSKSIVGLARLELYWRSVLSVRKRDDERAIAVEQAASSKSAHSHRSRVVVVGAGTASVPW